MDDCAKSKAEVAAERLAEIDPATRAKGIKMMIPMPGHRITDLDECRKGIMLSHQLIKGSDAIFLLTDSRESRWLPALLGALENKLVMTAALGFDSYVVMRHGIRGSQDRLGCYFCQDSASPIDTISGRTLDQQCTVSRPGLSMIASAIAVELMVSILQHPLKGLAPVSSAKSPMEPIPKEGSLLGVIPHQIRGFLGHFRELHLVGEASNCCCACSDNVLSSLQDSMVETIMSYLADENALNRSSGAARHEIGQEEGSHEDFCLL